MTSALPSSPTIADPQQLLAEIAALKAAFKVELDAREQRINALEHQITTLKRVVFGPRSEKDRDGVDRSLAVAGRQPFLFVEEIARAAQRLAEEQSLIATVELKREGRPAPRKSRRTSFPDHLPCVATTIELDACKRTCCGQSMKAIGEETRRTLERVETFVVHEIARTTYACQVCHEHVKTAPGPGRVIDRGLLGTSALAHVIAERFGNHMPYHRLEKKSASEGLDLSRSVHCRSTLACAEILEPIAKQMAVEIRAVPVVRLDDTPVVLQQGGTGESRRSFRWIYHDLEDRHLYDFTESRSRDGPFRILGIDTMAFMQADAFSGHDALFALESKRVEVACWAHARRYFKMALDSEKEFATEAIAAIRQLYDPVSLFSPAILRHPAVGLGLGLLPGRGPWPPREPFGLQTPPASCRSASCAAGRRCNPRATLRFSSSRPPRRRSAPRSGTRPAACR
jgi:transposase